MGFWIDITSCILSEDEVPVPVVKILVFEEMDSFEVLEN